MLIAYCSFLLALISLKNFQPKKIIYFADGAAQHFKNPILTTDALYHGTKKNLTEHQYSSILKNIMTLLLKYFKVDLHL